MSAEKTLLTDDLQNAMIVALKKGDEHAKEVLMESCRRKMTFLAHLYHLNDEEAALSVDEGYAAVFEKPSILNETVKYEPWAMRKVSECALKHLRERYEREEKKLFDYPERGDHSFVYDIADEKNAEEGSLIATPEERNRILDNLMGSLSDAKRVICLMYFYEEISIIEIAAELGISQVNVVDELSESKKILKEAIPFEMIEQMFRVHTSTPISFFISLLKDAYHEPVYVEEEEKYKEIERTLTMPQEAVRDEFSEPKDPLEDWEDLEKKMKRRKMMIIGLMAVLVLIAGGLVYAVISSQAEREAALRAHEAALQSLRIEFWTDENGHEPSVFEYGPGTVDVKSFVKSYEGKLDLNGNDTIDTSLCGTTEIIYSLSKVDEAGNNVVWNVVRHYTVADTQPPVIEFEKNVVELSQGDEFDPSKNILSVKDPADGNIALTKIRPGRLVNADYGRIYEYNWYMIEHNVNTIVEGDYTVTVHAEDVHGNVTEKSYHVTVGEKLITKCFDYGPGTRQTSCELSDRKYEGKYTSDRYENLVDLFQAIRVHFNETGVSPYVYRIIEVDDFREQPLYYYFQCEN